MHERALRTVLFIRAIEESDPVGEVLPLADRAEATRFVLRGDSPLRGAFSGERLSAAAERALRGRAERLFERVQVRSPAVNRVLDVVGGADWLARALMVIALATGIGLSALDGSRQINILAYPLLGLIAWNLLVLAVALVAVLRRGGPPGAPLLSQAYEKWFRGRAATLLRHSSAFNAPLAEALTRFAAEWTRVVRPSLLLRAQRLFHLCAALVAVGLIAGLYLRGVVFRYDAGWESTFLGPGAVRGVLTLLYGPAAALANIALPVSLTEVEALRFRAGAQGVNAAPWIHLIAVTAALYIILPRLLAVVLATAALWRRAWRPVAPASLIPYARGILLGAANAQGGVVRLVCYAYEPGRESVAGLQALLRGALGDGLKIDARESVPYGEEDSFIAQLSSTSIEADWNVLLMNLAATPETESHGVMIAALRDSLIETGSTAPMLVVIDESTFAGRMQGDVSYEQRLTERRQVWREFVAGYGLDARTLDLSSLARAGNVDAPMRQAVRAAFWSAPAA
jgi:hypothetical protein